MEITEKKWRDLQLIYCRDVNCKRSIQVCCLMGLTNPRKNTSMLVIPVKQEVKLKESLYL